MDVEAIGSYHLTELLGSGAMGEVYKATDAKMFDRVVALKLLSEKFARNENARSRFRNEVQYASHLDHPNIIKIFDHGEFEGRPYFVMEFLDGIDLARFMKQEPNRSIERNVEIARQLCEALDFAHRHNVVHRDVKPANVMIIRRGGTEQVKLVDFGIIHVDNSNMTRDGTQPGTSAYSSPEQLRNDAIDHRSDLFSLGIVLYELFTGLHPFDGPSEALITHHILQREPEAPRKKNAAIPAAIDVLVMKLLEKDPALRPQSAGEVAESLRQQMRKLQSRWASTDPAEYENLDEITREAVDKLVAWARQKEADGALPEAVDAYEKALRLAPDSERIQRRIPKLRHRIESERALKEHLARAEASLQAGKTVEARDHLKQAWILSPESEDVAALELRIKEAESGSPDDRERKQFVDGLVAEAERALDQGGLDEARSRVVAILQKYPTEPVAGFMLERILAILRAGVDYKAYRAALGDAKDAITAGRFAEAREACARASALWPGDLEVAAVEREVGERADGEIRAIATRVEQALLRADDPELDEKTSAEHLAVARNEIERAKLLGVDEARARAFVEDVDRVERALRERVARLERIRHEQETQRSKLIDMFLQRGRNLLADATLLAGRVATDPAPAVEKFEQAREAFDRVLLEDAAQSEALESRRQIESGLRELAVKVDAREQEVNGFLEAARAAVAEAEVSGGAHARDLDGLFALLEAADQALDSLVQIEPSHSDVSPLRDRVISLRQNARIEKERREAGERRAKEQAEAEAAARRAKEQAQAEAAAKRAQEQAEADAAAERAKEQAEADTTIAVTPEPATRAPEPKSKSKARPAPPAEGAAPEPAADGRKLVEFESGLKKHRRLLEQGKTREAAGIRKILESEAASDPRLRQLLQRELPPKAGGAAAGGGKAKWIAVAAGVVVLSAAGAWVAMRPNPVPPAPKPAEVKAEPVSIPPEPFQPPPSSPPVSTPEAHDAESATTKSVMPAVSPPPPSRPAVTPSETAHTTTPTPAPRAPASPPPASAKPVEHAPVTPAVTHAPAAEVPAAASTGMVSGTLLDADGHATGAGYQIEFDVRTAGEGATTITVSTDASGQYRFPFEGSVNVRPMRVLRGGVPVAKLSIPLSSTYAEGTQHTQNVPISAAKP